ncbi:mechanosensitive ion channel protein 10-like [Impatiens glandulifera]|uniref:mechanosensitive ion channel protein 10-like n=1 Tax=Impatiens glandulifera TaxID=253017 RepID=UPI001FB0F3BA|nr:mechanosensitive ion channel protein 10-like [Impatiens glandulifera]
MALLLSISSTNSLPASMDSDRKSLQLGEISMTNRPTCPSPGSGEAVIISISDDDVPKIPTPRKSLTRSLLSKPKSRFGEQPLPMDPSLLEEIDSSDQRYFSTSPANSVQSGRTNTLYVSTPKTPLIASPGGVAAGEDDGAAIYKKVSRYRKLKYKRVKIKVLLEWIVFLCLMGNLIASLTVDELRKKVFWGLVVWKWCLLVLVTFSGMLVTKWSINFIALLIESNFLFERKVLYFVHGLKNSVQVFIWLSLVLLCWLLLFKHEAEVRSPKSAKFLDFVSWTIVSLLVGSFSWLLKTLLLKILASSFHVKTFFDRIQESVFNHYILMTLSGQPVMEIVGGSETTSQMSFPRKKKGKDTKVKEVIDVNKLYRMKQEKVSAWTMKVLVDSISTSGLSTISNGFTDFGGEKQRSDNEITNEMEAIAAAYHIFINVAKPGSKYIEEEDLKRFMIKEEVDAVFPLLEGSEPGRIDRKTLTDWVVKAHQSRKALAHALSDTKTAVKQLNKLLTGMLVVVVTIVWLLLTEIASTKVLLFLSSQLVVAAFIFKNTGKTIFEALIFVFVMHPYDVGDRCVIDGVQMTVEEMNILNTVFLRFDNEKIYYPNSVLAMKPISNFYRSPDMGDSMEFSIDFKTPLEKIGAMKERIKLYLEKNPHHWHPFHNVVVKEIENVNKIKIGFYFNHTMNFQQYGEKLRRKSDLMLEMKNIFEQLNIQYNLLPQDVHMV